MTLEELLKALGAVQDGQKLVDAVKAIVEGKDGEITQKATQNRTAAKALKDVEDKLKASNEKLKKFADHIGVDEDAEDLDAALAEAAKAGKKGGDDALLKRLEKLETSRKKDKEDADKLLAEERGKRHALLKGEAIKSALTAGNATRADELVGLLTGRVQIGDDDLLTFTDDKGQSVKVEDGVKAWLSTRPEFVKNPQTPGGGSGGGTGGGTDTGGSLGKELAQQYGTTQKAAVDAQSHYFK